MPIARIMVLSCLFILLPIAPCNSLVSLDARGLCVYRAAGPTCLQELVSWMLKNRKTKVCQHSPGPLNTLEYMDHKLAAGGEKAYM